jgi:hypothetical protein
MLDTRGGNILDPVILNRMLDDAAERGAKRALERVGLHDENAGRDIHDLRNLIDSWRSTKRSVSKVVIQYATAGLLGFLAALFWFKYGKL